VTIEALDNIACESAPVADSHLANKAYVDAAVANGAGTASSSGDNIVSIPAHSLISCGLAPTDDAHLANKAYVDAAVAAAGTATPIEEPAGLGKVVVVDTLSDAATHTGTSLRDAITAATAWSSVVIKFSVAGTITLEQGEISLPGRITIDGENKITISGGGVSRLFVIGAKTVLSLHRLTITGGNGVGAADSQVHGGAIYFGSGGVLHASDVTFTGNGISGTAATCSGGAIYIGNSGRVFLKRCTFSNNSVTTTGTNAYGGVINVGSLPLIAEDCTFSGNYVSAGSNGYGGAISGGNMILRGCVFDGNLNNASPGTKRGGAIYDANGTAVIVGCEFKNNSVTTDSSSCIGGAVCTVYTATGQMVQIEDCSFSGNIGLYGAAVSVYGTNAGVHDIFIRRCVFDANVVSGSARGAAIYFYYCDATVEDCEFKNHSVGGANVIYAYGYTGGIFVVTINRCKFTGNSGSFTGGGFVYVCNQSQTYLYNCVFKDNTFTGTSGYHRCIYVTNTGSSAFIQNCTFNGNTGGGAFYCTANTSLTIYNSVEYGHANTSSGASSATITASKFLSDKDSTGRDIAYDSTKPLFAADGFTPVANSQVIDKGNNNYVMTAYDLPGKTRKVGTAVDLGAVEYQGA